MNKNFDVPQPQALPGPHAERRRSIRWNGYIPVFVYGHTADGQPFHEPAYSTVVNDRGALLIMATAVPAGERLLLINKVTQIEQECQVVYIGRQEGPGIETAIEFTATNEQFWHLSPGHQDSPLVLIDTRRKAR